MVYINVGLVYRSCLGICNMCNYDNRYAKVILGINIGIANPINLVFSNCSILAYL
jgi:hypothetical protein